MVHTLSSHTLKGSGLCAVSVSECEWDISISDIAAQMVGAIYCMRGKDFLVPSWEAR